MVIRRRTHEGRNFDSLIRLHIIAFLFLFTLFATTTSLAQDGFPLTGEKCGHPMRLIAFIVEPPVVEKILAHIGEPAEPPAVLPARAPPQVEMDFDQVVEEYDWSGMDQTAGVDDETWN